MHFYYHCGTDTLYPSNMIQKDNLQGKKTFGEFDVDKIKVETDIQKALEKYKTGCQSVPGLSAHTVTVMQNALLSATIEFNQEQLGCIHLLFAYLSDDTLVNMAGSISPELNKIEPSRLLNFKESNAPQSRSNDLAQSNANSALNQFTTRSPWMTSRT